MALKLGVIGTGAIGQDHIRRISQNLSGARIVAVTDIDEGRAKAAVKNLEGVRIEKNGQDVIRAADVDAVIVTSWGPTHEEYVLASIAAGKPVFCEKPLATTAEGCMNIVKAEVAHGKQLVQVGFMRRYDKGYRALKDVIVNGKIGEILMAHCAHRNPSVPSSYTTDMAITDTVIHEIDVLRWLINDDFISAQILMPKKTRHAENHLQDPQIVLLQTAGGVRIDVEVFVNCQYGYDIQCEVVGETGTARLPEPSNVLMRSGAQRSVEILTDWKKRFSDSYDTELKEWIDSVKKGQFHGPSAWDGYVAAVTADACVKAQQTGQIVPISIPKRPALYNLQER
ncbi:Gfo/Idh/MocA family protein [Petroclostridium xylanilyticum]|uniref:Gfo/Idh/MocA family protein n=1 Tax=Petroclostridium xylanilyticum TaxID=1792311 RepID=UPI000B97F4CD|nr:Gfo/Idh/MocA family oxidoreductase [Petroclostridium xylanilyticum]